MFVLTAAVVSHAAKILPIPVSDTFKHIGAVHFKYYIYFYTLYLPERKQDEQNKNE